MALQGKEVLWQGAITGDVFWCAHDRVNAKSNKFQYDLCNLSGPAVAKLSELGANIKQKHEDMGNFVTSKSTYPIKTVNAAGDELTGTSIGNGSKATAAIKLIKGSNSYGTFVMVETQKLRIDDLVEYHAAAEEGEGGEILMEGAL